MERGVHTRFVNSISTRWFLLHVQAQLLRVDIYLTALSLNAPA